MSSISVSDHAPVKSLHDTDEDERSRFITMLIRTMIFYRRLNPHNHRAEIRKEAAARDVPVAEVKAEWDERLRMFKHFLLEGWIKLPIKDPDDEALTEVELKEFKEIFLKSKNPWRHLPTPVIQGRKCRSGQRPIRAYEGASEEDFIMDLILKLLESMPDFLLPEYEADATPWARTVVLNQARHAVRDSNIHKKGLKHAAQDPGSWLYARRLGESAERTVMRRLDELAIHHAIFRLPEHLADVAFLRYQGDSYTDIARTLGINENTVKMRLRTIRSPKVRAALGL